MEHQFYCLQCGNKGIPLWRKGGKLHKKFHRKKLFCIYCKQEVNHMECSQSAEVQEFKENFLNGLYKEEAENSINFIQQERRMIR